MANSKVLLKARLILYHKGQILLLKQTKPNGGNCNTEKKSLVKLEVSLHY